VLPALPKNPSRQFLTTAQPVSTHSDMEEIIIEQADAVRPGLVPEDWLRDPCRHSRAAMPLASQHGQVPAGALIAGRDAELPLSIHVEGDVDQRLARTGRRDLRHVEQAEPLVEGGQRALTLIGLLPPLVSMPTECRKRPRSQMLMSVLWSLANSG
jgi:hypothetical protein